MTATSQDFWTELAAKGRSDVHLRHAIELRATSGQRFMMRTVQRLFGASLSIAALCLWVLPIGTDSSAEILCKMLVTIILGASGAALWQNGSPLPAPELEIDIVRREVRLVRWYGETRTLVTRCQFCDLSTVEFDGHDVRLWDADGDMIADLRLPNMEAVDRLRFAMEDKTRLTKMTRAA